MEHIFDVGVQYFKIQLIYNFYWGKLLDICCDNKFEVL